MSPVAASVDEYMAALPEDQRGALEKLRETIKAVVPEATEVISYQLPTFRYRGRMLVAFGAATNHCALYVMSKPVMEAHREELKSYATGKGSVRFPPGKPLPDALVTKLVKARIQENEAAAASRSKR